MENDWKRAQRIRREVRESTRRMKLVQNRARKIKEELQELR